MFGRKSLQSENMQQFLFPDPEALASLCRRHRILRLSLFGSTLRGSARPDSDIDLLVEFEPQAKPGLIALAGIELELSLLLKGRKVDLRTPHDLSRYFREEVLRTAEVQYAA
jgi:predicted nucleotidyltransferase